MAITPFIAVIKYITSQEDFRAAVLFPRPKWYPTRTPDTVQHVADKVLRWWTQMAVCVPYFTWREHVQELRRMWSILDKTLMKIMRAKMLKAWSRW